MTKRNRILFLFSLFVLIFSLVSACRKDEKDKQAPPPVDNPKPDDPQQPSHKTTPYPLVIPPGWAPIKIPADNPLTVEGVTLGRKLFYDPVLSKNNTMSCASCHNMDHGFTDNGKQFSEGLNGEKGTRNSMPIFNLGWVENYAMSNHRFFWDGGASNLESQAVSPITNPIEMNETMANVVLKLQQHSEYPAMFKNAFGTDSITTKRIVQAIAQFERIIISSNSKMDRYLLTNNIELFTDQEIRGMELFNSEDKADCFHCHSIFSPFSSDFLFHNNGHQSADEGLKRVTGRAEDIGKFRTPTLRNLVFTAPYMHDGRFQTLEQVVEFYNSGAQRVPPADPFIAKHPTGLNLTTQEKADLVAFLKTMSDSSFLLKAGFRKP